ncbi:uncharacterized protein [Argopecten irradians]|uniref:uncharacterized protein n=1 Tax=Argopecten irradians TaxID=31199 RepID=UPI0037129498
MVSRDMYGQCLPDNSLDLTISSAATHYLSKQICQIKNGVFLHEADNEEQKLMKEQGKLDWRTCVVSRGRELIPGGFLITMNSSTNERDERLSLGHNGTIQLGRIVSEMASEQIITQEEYLATNYNAHYRNADEFMEPFCSALPGVDELGLGLVSLTTFKNYVPNPTIGIVSKGGLIQSRLDNPRVQPIHIADFGTADGRASISLINDIIEFIHFNLGKEQPIVVYYNDQPQNDFNLLSNVIQDNTTALKLTGTEHIYQVMVSRDMYGQCLPDNTLDLAISSAATHYLSKQVCQIKNGVFLHEADEEEQKLMKEQGKLDWRTCVVSRGRELKPGGFLVTMNSSTNEHDEIFSVVENGTLQLGRMVSEMASEQIISQDEYLAMNFNSHYHRKEEDFKEPFCCALPEENELGLELVSMKAFKRYAPNPTIDFANKGGMCSKDTNTTDKMEYSRWIRSMVYPWFYHALYNGLSTTRTEEEKQSVIDQYFSRLQKHAFEHCDFKPFLLFTQVVIKKTNT